MNELEGAARVEQIRREVAEMARQLSELDVMLADYQVERDRLIRELRRAQADLREALASEALHRHLPDRRREP